MDVPVEFSKCWTYSEPDSNFSSVTTDEVNAYLGSAGARIAAVSISNGNKLWTSEFGGEIASNLLSTDGGLFVVTDSVSTDAAKPRESTLRVLSKVTGIPNKTIPLTAADSFQLGVDSGSVIVVSKGGDIYAFDPATSALKWTRKPTGGVNGKAYIGGGKIIIGTTDGQILRLSSITGEIELTVKADSAPTAVRSTVDGKIVYGDARGRVVAVDERWKFRSGAQISNIYEANGALVVTSFDNFVYFLTLGGGGVIWKKRMAGRIADVSFTGTNSLLIFTFGGDTAVLAELKKGKTIGQIAFPQPTETVDIPDTSTETSVFTSNGTAYSFSTKPCTKETAPAK